MDKTRKRRILEMLDTDGFASVAVIAETLGCTQATARRELAQLEKEGLLSRVRGGAIRTKNNFVKKNVKESYYQHLHEKMEIARLAYDLIEDGDTIAIDDASTCLHLAQMILTGTRRHLKVVTNSILLAERLLDAPSAQLELVGGTVTKYLGATEGEAPCRQLDGKKVDKVFLGVNGIDFTEGITLTGYPQQNVKQKMMQIGKECYILADSSKFGKVCPLFLCPVTAPSAIVTDREVPLFVLEEAEKKGVPILKRKKPVGNV